MEDFPLLILFFIIYLIAGSSGKKKKSRGNPRGARRTGPARTRAQGEQYDARALARDRQAKDGFRNAFSEEPIQVEHACAQSRLHLHEVTNDQMLHAAEGDDPCHAGGILEPADLGFEGLSEDEQAQRRLDVLRGVVMSEILTRPQERRAWQRSRQRTNGY